MLIVSLEIPPKPHMNFNHLSGTTLLPQDLTSVAFLPRIHADNEKVRNCWEVGSAPGCPHCRVPRGELPKIVWAPGPWWRKHLLWSSGCGTIWCVNILPAFLQGSNNRCCYGNYIFLIIRLYSKLITFAFMKNKVHHHTAGVVISDCQLNHLSGAVYVGP